MEHNKAKKRIAILGGGPSGLFIYKRLIESDQEIIEIDVFEKKGQLGAGMPYSREGANEEHITNVSANEVPPLVTSMEEWIKTIPTSELQKFNVDPETFHAYKVLPRLLFGQYLSSQFSLLQCKAKQAGIITRVHLHSTIIDIADRPDQKQVEIQTVEKDALLFNYVIICTGHHWPAKYEGTIPGYYDSPYPPSKLGLQLNHSVAIRGSSLTAIDAIRTLARHNGSFQEDRHGKLSFQVAEHSPAFKLILYSKGGLLPAIRFHLQDPNLSHHSLLTPEQIDRHKAGNDGFVSLDFIFEKDFKEKFREEDPAFYERIRNRSLENFVNSMMEIRGHLEPFQLFRAEYAEAEKSIQRKKSVYWKERLAILSFALNYPAKYLSAEDMQRLQKVLMPLISIVIAFVPQSSCKELLALNDAGILDILSVESEGSHVEPESRGGITYHYTDANKQMHAVYYRTFVDCIGQPHLSFDQFPFKSLAANKSISPARLRFRSAEAGRIAMQSGSQEIEQDVDGDYYLKVPGIAITDNFQVIDQDGDYNSRIFIMAVPYIGGYNPDYSGLDFCEAASGRISTCILESFTTVG